jgi:hypothetical protein
MFWIHVIFGPKPTMVGFNDGAANIQAHPHTVSLGAEKGLKHALGHGFCNPRTSIGYLDPEHGWESARF